MTLEGTGRLIHGLVKPTQVCKSFVVPLSKLCRSVAKALSFCCDNRTTKLLQKAGALWEMKNSSKCGNEK